nr:PREDICTED: basic leucine zipper transcriptional factor ATF-like [Opisthocomus hoazin]
MPHSSDSSDSSSFSQSPPPSKQDSSDDMRKVQRREKNRIAAQKSRLRQTQKADTLHLSILTSAPPPPEVLYATHSFHQPHISSPRFQH